MNARRTPARIGEAHLTDQIPNFRTYGWATLATPTLPTPIEPKSFAMPCDDSLRLDDEHCRPPVMPQLRDPDQEDSISPTETELLTVTGTLQDQELLAKSKNLCLQNGASSETILQTGVESSHGLERLHAVAL
jgi:hypothetical protein